MATLVLKFLGTFDVLLDGRRVQTFESSKVRALLAYLVLEGHRPLPRESLADMFWPESKRPRQNLRQALFNLRKVLCSQATTCEFLVVTSQSVAFPRSSNVWVDVWEFESLIEKAAGCSREGVSYLEQAVALYQGDLLAGLYVRNALAFEEWHRLRREALHNAYVRALNCLISQYQLQGRYEQALNYARRLQSLEPWSDETTYVIMELLDRLGETDAALETFQHFVEYLRTEEHREPAQSLVKLYRRLEKKRRYSHPNERVVDIIEPWTLPHLPTFPTPFVGREAELEQIRVRLLQPESRLQTIIGFGGIGKTRLAVEAGRRFQHLFEDGVVFVPLNTVESATFIPHAIASALGLFPSQSQSPASQVLDYLAEKEMLLILDNFEHVREGRKFLLQILERAPRVRLLVTSHEPLELYQEWRLPLDGLPYPTDVEEEEQLSEYEAVRLFIEDARRLIPDFSPSGAEKVHIARICSLVGGAPLAIELATSLLPMYSLQGLAERIAHNLDVLSTQMPDVPERHRSLRAVFNQMWASLPERERSVFRRLSVFQGEFSTLAAQEVAQANEHALATLVRKSLLYKRDTPQGGRYRMHPVLRQYALESLYRDHQETRDVRNRHMRYVFGVVKRCGESIRGAQQAEAFQLLRDSMPDVREAWQWALQQQAFLWIDDILEALYWFHELYGGWEEGRILFYKAEQALRSVRPSVRSVQLCRIFGRVLMYEAWFVLRLSDVEHSRNLVDEAWSFLETCGEPRDRAMALLVRGTVRREEGAYRDAVSLLKEGLAVYEQLGTDFDFERANALVLTAHVLDTLGENMDEVEHLYTQALEIFRRLENPLGTAQALGSLGVVMYRRGEYQRAEKYLLEGLHWWEQLSAASGMAVVLLNLGNVAIFQKQYDRARKLFERSAALYRRMGSRFGWAYAMHNLGELSEWQGDVRAAQEYYTKSLNIFRQLDHQWSIALTLSFLADTYVYTRQFDQARRLLVEALDIVQGLDVPPLRLRVLTSVGYYLLATGDFEHAKSLLSVVCLHPSTDSELKERAHFLVKSQLERLGIAMPTPENRAQLPHPEPFSLEESLQTARRLLSK